MSMPTLAQRKDQLEKRLEDGWVRIFDAEKQGTDVAKWEAFWLSLLGEYEAVCDQLVKDAAA